MKKEAKIKKAFAVLELAEGASEAEINKAYRKLALKGHPDRFGQPGHLAKTIKNTNFKNQRKTLPIKVALD